MDHDTALHVAAQAAAFWTALNLLVLLVLSLLVVRQRNIHKVTFGDGAEPTLAQAIRAFGNAAEYAPLGVAGFIVLAIVGAPQAAVHLSGGLLFLGRVLHAIALSRSPGVSVLRSTGMLLTWVAYILEVVALMIFAVT